MKTIKTSVALGCVDGKIAVFNELYCERKPLTNEHQSNEDAFIQFANAKNFPELMIAVDALVEKMGMTDFINDAFAIEKPLGTNPSQAETVCRYFENRVPTRTALQRTSEALEAWDITNAKRKEIVLTNGPDAAPMYTFTFLEDIVKAREDLARASIMIAWLIGKTDFKTLKRQLTNDKKRTHIHAMSGKKPAFLHEYYKKLEKNTGNMFSSFGANIPIDRIHLYDEQIIEPIISDYVRSMFNLLLSDERKVMNHDLTTDRFFNTILAAAWSFFADGLNETNGVDAICVCKHCHRFFQQKRSTKQYCSDSCRVMALREGKTEKSSPHESNIMKLRK